jgi:hypothetical protein
MSDLKYRPSGYFNKKESASILGMSTKSFDRRRKFEPTLADSLRFGNQLWFLEKMIYDYFELSQRRGYI